MANVAGFDVVFSVNGRAVPVGVNVLIKAIEELGDRPEHRALFAELARSTHSSVRSLIANMENLDAETLQRLADDPSTDVVESLLRRHVLTMPPELLFAIVRRSAGFASIVAECPCVDFEEKVGRAVVKLLSASTDPAVRYRLAGNARSDELLIPRALFRKLLRDDDPDVAFLARETLKWNY